LYTLELRVAEMLFTFDGGYVGHAIKSRPGRLATTMRWCTEEIMIMQSDDSDEDVMGGYQTWGMRWYMTKKIDVNVQWWWINADGGANDDDDDAADEKTRKPKPERESRSGGRREKEEALDRLVDFDFDFDLRFDTFHKPLLGALLLLGRGRHYRVCLEIVVRPRSSCEPLWVKERLGHGTKATHPQR
jgi:hypothetical protein